MAVLAESGSSREAAVAGQEYRDLPLVAREILDALCDELADLESQLASDLEDELRLRRMDKVRALAAEVELCGELTIEHLRLELANCP